MKIKNNFTWIIKILLLGFLRLEIEKLRNYELSLVRLRLCNADIGSLMPPDYSRWTCLKVPLLGDLRFKEFESILTGCNIV